MNTRASCLWIPRKDFTDFLRESLTVSTYQMDGTQELVSCYRTDRKGYVGIPRVAGLKLISADSVDLFSRGRAVRFPKEVSLRDFQIPFVEGMLARAEVCSDFIAKAPTGKGKTVCALSLIQARGRSAAVVVDQENLLDQWVERCVEHLGLKPEDIGVVRGPRCDYKGKAITICMVQTLSRRQLPDEFYNAFGTVIFDECHTAGAPTFSRVLMAFSAELRVGLSATPDRKDALQKVLAWNLGSVDVVMESVLGKSSVYVLENDSVYSWRANNSKMTGGYINEVAADAARNLKIVKAVKWLYESGRDVLVIGDRVEHLCSLMALAEASGLPRGDLGLYAKSRTVFQYEKDPRPPRKPEFLVRGAPYSPVRLVMVQKTVPKKERTHVAEKARVVFATYGVIAKGVDIPRLSAGVDATSRSEATQVLGRILRIMEGKLRPIWVTFADINSFRSLYQLSNRLKDYLSSNAEVFLWDPRKGKKKLDVREYRRGLDARISLLRQSRITMSLDGSNTIVIPSTPNDSENSLARRTARSDR